MLAVASIVFFSIPGGVVRAQEALNKVLVVVNESAITQADLEKRIALFELDYRSAGREPPARRDVIASILEDMIVDSLLLELARRERIIISASQVDYALSVIAQQNQLTLAQLRTVVEQGGVAFDIYRDDLQQQLALRQLINSRIGRTINVSMQEIDEYLAQNPSTVNEADRKIEVAQILFALPAGASDAERREISGLADDVRQRLLKGLPFEEAVAQYSSAQEVANGGSLGLRTTSQLPEIFLNALGGLSVGGISGVFESPRGFHILKLVREVSGSSALIAQREVRHILLRPTAFLPKEQVRVRLERIRDRIVAGEDFSEVAKLQSEDAGTRALGGSLGWVEEGSFPPEFEQALAPLQVNEISPVFETGAGLHIAQIVGEREVDVGDNLRRREAEQAIRAKKTQEALEQWTLSLREDAYVQYRVAIDG